MLTNDDLRKIGDLIDQRLDVKLDEKLNEKLNEKLEPLKKDIKHLKNNDKKICKDLSLVLKYLDSARANYEKRITRIEDHLHLPSME